MIRVLIADDHTMIREGLKLVLSSAPDLSVVGEAENGDAVMRQLRSTDFDVLVLDLSMPGPGRSGAQLIKQIHDEKPQLRILILSMHQESQYAIQAIKSGAAGYLTKECASVELVNAIRKIANGGAYISAEVAEQLALSAMPGNNGPAHKMLSSRELEVFLLLVNGIAVSQIAEQLHLSIKTVSTHKSRILEKMHLHNLADLIRYAINHQLTNNPNI